MYVGLRARFELELPVCPGHDTSVEFEYVCRPFAFANEVTHGIPQLGPGKLSRLEAWLKEHHGSLMPPRGTPYGPRARNKIGLCLTLAELKIRLFVQSDKRG